MIIKIVKSGSGYEKIIPDQNPTGPKVSNRRIRMHGTALHFVLLCRYQLPLVEIFLVGNYIFIQVLWEILKRATLGTYGTPGGEIVPIQVAQRSNSKIHYIRYGIILIRMRPNKLLL